jgi:hypothetical protein
MDCQNIQKLELNQKVLGSIGTKTISGTFVDAGKRTNPVTRTVSVIQTGLPERCPCHNIHSRTLQVVWKCEHRELDLANQYPRVRFFLFVCGGAKMQSPRHVSSTIWNRPIEGKILTVDF